MGFLDDNCTFYRMTPELVNQCEGFVCSKNEDIDEFFHEEYADYAREHLGESYCFVKDDTKEIVCAFTLACSSINTRPLNNKEKRHLQKKIPHVKQKSQYPAMLIGQLVVFDKFRAQKDLHIGDELLDFIKAILFKGHDESDYSININFNNVGCRFLIADAVNDPNGKVIGFYQKNGFNFLFKDEADELRSINKVNKLPFWKRHLGHIDQERKKTRLMYFDLLELRPA